MSPTLALYWGVPGYIILYILLAGAVGIFIYRASRLFKLLRVGAKENRFDHLWRRAALFLPWVLGGWCTLRSVSKKDVSGIGHFIMFLTFIFFFLNYIYLFTWGAWHQHTSLFELGNLFSLLFSNILEVTALLTLGAVIWALGRRYIARPQRLERGAEPAIILVLVFFLVATHFLGEAARISLSHDEQGGFISFMLFGALNGLSEGAKKLFYDSVWWFHLLLLLGFLVYIPFSKHLHIIAGLFNVFFRSLGAKGALTSIDIETAERLGVEKIEEFSWKQLLDLYACAECGRCQTSCPAYLSGKRLSPQQMIKNLKNLLIEKGVPSDQRKPALIEEKVSHETIWDCLTCYACQQVCPVGNEHVDKIVEIRRNLVLVKNKIPETAERALRMLMTRGDPCIGTTFLRTDWTEGLDVKKLSAGAEVEMLYWVGCMGALDERSVKATVAFATLMKHAGVDFGVLGAQESCCGDPARRMGHELLFQTQAQRNIETLKNYKIEKIVTSCPHGYNTLKNEYPQYGGKFEVVHHTEFIAELVAKGKLRPARGLEKRVAYHDPCYLGRYNDIYEAPRAILSSIPSIQFVELNRHGRESFCCGGGGGHMWLEENRGERVNALRTQDILDAQVDIVAIACPFCLQMLEEGVRKKHLQGSVEVMDISELFQKVI